MTRDSARDIEKDRNRETRDRESEERLIEDDKD